jgi:UTP-glucose-1-phosphate uridylyltransferase
VAGGEGYARAQSPADPEEPSLTKIRKAVIPAAGLGTRFLPATKAQPKEMLPLIDKPAIQYVVEEAVRAGLTDILIITGRGKRTIEDHFDRSVELEVFLEAKGKFDELKQVREISDMATIHYIRQRDALGLGHAVGVAEDHVGDEPFAVPSATTSWPSRTRCSPRCSGSTSATDAASSLRCRSRVRRSRCTGASIPSSSRTTVWRASSP